MTAANIDKAWIGRSVDELIGTALGRRVRAINDADAAGLAEMRLGAGRECAGTVLLLTIGTGIGSALFVNHRLVPNTELGHIELAGKDAETRVSGASRERRRLRWKVWATEFNEYLARIEAYFWPDLIILGGGVSKSMDKYRDTLQSRAPIVAAQFLNTLGHHRRGDVRRRVGRQLDAREAVVGVAGPSARRDLRAVSLPFRAASAAPRPRRKPGQRHGWADRKHALPLSRGGSDASRVRLGPHHRVVAQQALRRLQDRIRHRPGPQAPVRAGRGGASGDGRGRLAAGRVGGRRRAGHRSRRAGRMRRAWRRR